MLWAPPNTFREWAAFIWFALTDKPPKKEIKVLAPVTEEEKKNHTCPTCGRKS